MRVSFWIGVLFVGLIGCKSRSTEPDQPQPGGQLTSGTANFSRYLAVGNSLTAGFMNGGLYRDSQLASYPNLLAQRFRLANGGTFVQPLFPDGQQNGTGYYRLTNTLTPDGQPVVEYVTNNTALRSESPLLLTKYTGTAPDNMGIPGIRLADVQDQNLSQQNPYFERLLTSGQERTTYLAYVKSRSHTFFTCWMGNNDILGFVTSGGRLPITGQTAFRENLNALLDALTANNAKGVLANLTDLADMPYLTARTVAQLGGAQKATIYIRTGTGLVRVATNNDYILYNADSIGIANRTGLNKGYFAAYPLNNEDVLDADEAKQAQNATDVFNKIIAETAAARQLPVMDVQALMHRVKIGFTEDNVLFNTVLPAGETFSLDGIHPTARGYALLANEYLKTINAHYQTRFPLYNLSTLK
ncbi:SGNH/GDSL hydrolase family protein [Nibrella viscosa]|uniref:SGNH/GDSL hydrolase family protein n=1 Tax=Nibrella viscosa TaxID=1084524 RepID=A0ABP8KQ95_9BACT